MKKLLFGATAAIVLAMAVPASAQVWVGADPSGAGVQVGPLGVGVGPRFGDRYYGDRYYGERYYRGDAYAWGGDCRVVRERIRTPSGRLIIRTHREC